MYVWISENPRVHLSESSCAFCKLSVFTSTTKRVLSISTLFHPSILIKTHEKKKISSIFS